MGEGSVGKQKEKGENGGIPKDEGLLTLINAPDASSQSFDFESSEIINIKENHFLHHFLVLPAPNQILLFTYGAGYIIIRNINDTMQIDHIHLAEPLSSVNIFQKIMVQLGMSAFGEPPGEQRFHSFLLLQ